MRGKVYLVQLGIVGFCRIPLDVAPLTCFTHLVSESLSLCGFNSSMLITNRGVNWLARRMLTYLGHNKAFENEN